MSRASPVHLCPQKIAHILHSMVTKAQAKSGKMTSPQVKQHENNWVPSTVSVHTEHNSAGRLSLVGLNFWALRMAESNSSFYWTIARARDGTIPLFVNQAARHPFLAEQSQNKFKVTWDEKQVSGIVNLQGPAHQSTEEKQSTYAAPTCGMPTAKTIEMQNWKKKMKKKNMKRIELSVLQTKKSTRRKKKRTRTTAQQL